MPGLECDSDSDSDDLGPAHPTSHIFGMSHCCNATAGPSRTERTQNPQQFVGDFFGNDYSQADFGWQEPDYFDSDRVLKATLQSGVYMFHILMPLHLH